MEEDGTINQKTYEQSIFVDPRRLTTCLAAVLYLDIGLTTINFIWKFFESARQPIMNALRASIPLMLLLGVIGLAYVPSTIILFIAWINRLMKNLPSLNSRAVAYSSRWTILLFLIPVINLYWPYKVMNEIWQVSCPENHASDGVGQNKAKGPVIIIVWWTLWLASLFGPMIVEENETAHAFVSHIAILAALVFSIYVTKTISKMQLKKYDEVRA